MKTERTKNNTDTAQGGAAMKLLYAEDEPALSEAVVDYLTYHKYIVDAVYNGEDAYDYAISGGYDGIIVDGERVCFFDRPRRGQREDLGISGFAGLRLIDLETDLLGVHLGLCHVGRIRHKLPAIFAGNAD